MSTLSHNRKRVARKLQVVQRPEKQSSFLSNNEQWKVGAKTAGVTLFLN